MGFFSRDRDQSSAPANGVNVTIICANYSGDERVTLPAGSTVADAIELATGYRSPTVDGDSLTSVRENTRWVCRVNGALASDQTPLVSGARVLIAPRKMEGASVR